MGLVNQIDGDMHVRGAISSTTLSIPNSTILNAAVGAAADIDATKLEHQYNVHYFQGVVTTAAVAEAKLLHTVYGATATVVAIEAGCVTAPTGSDTIVIDVQKSTGGGAFATILSATITLDSGNTNLIAEAGTISSASAVTGDVFKVIVTIPVSNSTGLGLWVEFVIREDAA